MRRPPGRGRGTGSGARRRPGRGSPTRTGRCGACRRTRTRSPPCSGCSRRAMSSRRSSVALGDGESRQAQDGLGLPPGRGGSSAMSPPTMKVSACSGARVMQCPQGIDRVRRAAPLDLEVARPRRARRRPWRAGRARAGRPRPGRRRPPCAAAGRPASARRGRARAGPRLLGHTRWPRCGGLKVPPRIPTAATEAQPPDVAVALDDVLERAQLAQRDRAARVELLGRVADLRAHPELAAVGEARRGVDVDARRVDALLERARGARVARSRSPPSGRSRGR